MKKSIMLAFNVNLLLDALSEKNVEMTSACANATHVKRSHNVITEFDKACTSPTTKLWQMYMSIVMLLKRYTHGGRTCLRAEHLTEVEDMLPYLVAASRCKCVSCLYRSDERPAYTGSEHTEGIPGRTVHCRSNRRAIQWCLYIHDITPDIQT